MGNLDYMKQYPIERDLFCEIFSEIDNLLVFEINLPFYGDEFIIEWHNDEWYILHTISGTLVNWYKHLGRCNTCNKDLNIDEYKEFARRCLEDIEYYIGRRIRK